MQEKSNWTDLAEITLEVLLQILKERENLGRKGVSRNLDALAEFSSEDIVKAVRGKQKAIYGEDNRQDLFTVKDKAVLNSADSVVSLWSADNVVDNGDGTSTLTTQNFGTSLNLCASEPFRNQPTGAFCSGFLIAPDIIATAGHCVEASNVTSTRFVFGYRMTDTADAQTVIANSEIYSGASIIDRKLTPGAADWALVKLDRKVTNHSVAPLRETGKIADDQAVYVIGHPSGLPIKYAPGANVRDNKPEAFFVANLDTFGGNSGSPVFNAKTNETEGILVRGDGDFVKSGTCRVSLVYPTTGGRGEDCTRTTQFSNLVSEDR